MMTSCSHSAWIFRWLLEPPMPLASAADRLGKVDGDVKPEFLAGSAVEGT